MFKPKKSKSLIERIPKEYQTDVCEFCKAVQGGYVDGNLDKYINIRNGHYCSECGKSEETT